MIEIKVRNPEDPESFAKALKIFTKQCKKDGFIREIRDRRYFKKPSEVNRMKKKEALRNAQKGRKNRR